MSISITAKTFDLEGSMEITPLPNERFGEIIRRVNRVATLDGGVAVNDGGFSYGDRDITINYQPVSVAHDDIARRLISLHTRVYLSMPDGFYEASIQSFDPAPEQNVLRLVIIAKLNED